MCHHGTYDVTLRVQHLGPSDLYMCTHVITVVTGELGISSPTLKITSLKSRNGDGAPACVI